MSIVGLLLAAIALVGIGFVKVKIGPSTTRASFQIILNMPEGSATENTAQCAGGIAVPVRIEPEITGYEICKGVASPFNFNGLVQYCFTLAGPLIR